MNEMASVAGACEIIVDEVFPHTLDVIWKTLTTPELMGRWLKMAPMGFEPKVGARFTYQTTPAGQWDGVIHCQVLEAVPNQRLAYVWRGGHEANIGYGALLETLVCFTLSAEAAGTRLRLVHSGFVLPKNETALKSMGEGWRGVVQRIGALSSDQN